MAKTVRATASATVIRQEPQGQHEVEVPPDVAYPPGEPRPNAYTDRALLRQKEAARK